MMIHLSKKSAQWVKIIIIFSVLACVLSVYPTIASAQKDLSALVKKVGPSVVVINVYDINGKIQSLGTGFFMTAEGALVTNYHVIEGGVRAEVKLSSGEVLPVEGILSEDNEGDLVLLTLGRVRKTFKPLKLANTNIEIGKPVVVIGSPFGLSGTVSDGIVSAVREVPELGKILQITAPISKGSSGSPVLNMEGEVVGVATLYIQEGQSLNFAISFERVKGLLSRKYGKARKLIESAGWSESAEGLYFLGISCSLDKRFDEAIGFFKKSIEKKPAQFDAYISMGWAYAELGRHDEAIEASKQAIRVKPDNSETYYHLALLYMKLERYHEGIEALREALQINPDNQKARSILGIAYRMLGHSLKIEKQDKGAIEAFKQAIRINPTDTEARSDLGDAYYMLGLTYMDSKQYYEGIEAFKEAIRAKPDDAGFHLGLGIAYLIIGNKTKALEEYKLLKELDVEKANKLFDQIYK